MSNVSTIKLSESFRQQFTEELTVLVFNALKEKYPNIDDATLNDIIQTQMNLYCNFLDQKFGFEPTP